MKFRPIALRPIEPKKDEKGRIVRCECNDLWQEEVRPGYAQVCILDTDVCPVCGFYPWIERRKKDE